MVGTNDVALAGASLGAFHAANFALRRADLFPRALCLSGVYDIAQAGWGERGEATYFHNPMDYVAHLHGDHLDWLRSRVRLTLVVGQGMWEDTTGALHSTRAFAGLLGEKGSRTSSTSGATTCPTTGRRGRPSSSTTCRGSSPSTGRTRGRGPTAGQWCRPPARGRPSSSRASSSGLCSSIVPTSVRDHVPQERVRRDLELQVVAAPHPARVLDVPDEDVVLRLGGREGAEVVLAHERLGGRRQPLLVERARVPPRAPGLERRRPAPPVDPVAVAAGTGGEAGVEVVRRLRGGDHRDVVGQFGVERPGSPLGRRPTLDVEGRHLAERVHAGVGAARDGETVPAREHLRQRGPHLPLDRAQARLARPSRGSRRRRTRGRAGASRVRTIAATHVRASHDLQGVARADRGRHRDLPRAGAAVDARRDRLPRVDRVPRPRQRRVDRHHVLDRRGRPSRPTSSGAGLRDEIARQVEASMQSTGAYEVLAVESLDLDE